MLLQTNVQNEWINQTKQKQTHRYREQSSSYRRGRGGGKGNVGKGVKCIVTGGNEIFGGGYTVVYTEVKT